MNDTTDVNEEKRESPFYSFFDADLVFDIIKIVILILVLVSSLFGISEPVHIESKSTQKRVDMRNNTHSFSVNSFYLIVF